MSQQMPEPVSPQQLAQACAEAMWARDAASQSLGMILVRVYPGEAEITMPVSAAMIQGHGTCHGGYLFTLADSAFAFACNSYNANTVAQQCSITYLAPARLGDLLTARARELSRSGRSGVYDVEISDQTGRLVALFRGHARTVKGEHLPGLTTGSAA
ncbi:MAG: hydroxyphenylacetyl-CoA thioesterase PaaI [Bosea sp. (in: a-proteobacteria)]